MAEEKPTRLDLVDNFYRQAGDLCAVLHVIAAAALAEGVDRNQVARAVDHAERVATQVYMAGVDLIDLDDESGPPKASKRQRAPKTGGDA
jgi:hypothetical protein